MSGNRVQGTVRWFSNRKGYGFITPTSANKPSEDDIFVHHSVISAEGYKTLSEGWQVEFDVVTEQETGKLKAENVTAVGGGYCTGPKRNRGSPSKSESSSAGGVPSTPSNNNNNNNSNNSSRSKPSPKPPQVFWHASLQSDVIDAISKTKSISTTLETSGTIDVAIDAARIKLGNGGYSSLARADGFLAEGTFDYTSSGDITLTWEKGLEWKQDSSSWELLDSLDSLITTFNLKDDNVVAVGAGETAATLWGDDKPDPKPTLMDKGFKMRKVTLTSPMKSKQGGRR